MPLVVFDVPSKRRFDLIPLTLKYIRDGKSLKRLAREIEQDVRHAHFLIQNARVLGFASSENNKLRLTTSGLDFLNASPKMKGFLLCKAMLSSRVISAILKHSGTLEDAADLATKEVSDFLVENVIVSRTNNSPMQRVTADRRASTVRQWVKWLERSLPSVTAPSKHNAISNAPETLDSK